MKKSSARNLAVLAILTAAVASVFSAPAFAQNAPAPATSIGAFPGGPGGRDTPMAETPRPNPLPPFYDPKLPVAQRVQNVVSLLTLEEKVALMQMASPSIPRLGIEPYHWWTEALHGMTHDLSTVFPQAIGLSATWNTNLHFTVSTAISTEGRAKNLEYRQNHIYNSMTGLDFWSPNVNIFRDPRWGRGQETYGEDPYLSGRFGVEFVKGIQGDHPVYFKAIATPKHFAVHSGPESLRHQFNAVVTQQDLFTTYLPQFEATFREGKAHSAMSTYSALNGVPNAANKWLLTDILRDQWGFKGYVVSDADALPDIYNNHRYLPNAVATSAAVVKAGNELDSGNVFAGGPNGARNISNANLIQALKQNLITEKEIDIALGRLMEARIRLGEFDPAGYDGNPYNKITTKMYNTPEHHELALTAARETMVLLKNDNKTLPLKTSIGTVAVMGPNANAITMQYGNYNGRATPEHQVTILSSIQKAVGADKVLTLSNLNIPLTGNIALAEPIKSDYLYTDASKSKKGLTVAFAATDAGLANPTKTVVSETGAIKAPEGVALDPSLSAKMTGVIVPPISGEYQLGAKASDAFKITLDGKVVLDQTQGGMMRVSNTAVSLEKDKAYSLVVEFTHSASTAGAATGGRGMGARGTGRGGPEIDPTRASNVFQAETGAPGAPTTRAGAPGGRAGAPGAAAPGGRAGGMGGRAGGMGMGGARGGGGQTIGSTPEKIGLTGAPGADDPLFQIAWTMPTADGMPANTAGGSLFAEAVDVARKADAIVIVVGIDGSQEGEQRDRSAIELPGVQDSLIRAVARAAGNKPVIVVNCSGSAVALNSAQEKASAVLQAWYPGQRGDAVADVLFGKYNPAGRLPVTFYKSTADLPAFTDYNMFNRTYRYDTKPVLYPFGYGLSYSSFEYSALSAPAKSTTGDDVKVTFTVKNTSAVDGDEVVQCYLNRELPPVDSKTLPTADKMTDEQATQLATPRKSLVGFARVPLKAGESKTVTFTITPQQLSLVVGKDNKREVRPEKLQLQVGGSSVIDKATLTQTLTLEGAAKAPEYRFVAPSVK